jgi:hypothetical protein
VLCRVAAGGSAPGSAGRPSATRRCSSAWYSAVTPSSLKRLAIVPNTGISSGRLANASRLRCTCLATSRSASAAPLRSNLLIATNSAEVEHVDLLELAGGAELGCHHVHRHVDQRHDRRVALADAEVSTTMRSKPVHLQAASTSGSAWLISLPKSRVAKLRMKNPCPKPPGVDRVHADPVAEQGAAALAPARVDRDHRRCARRRPDRGAGAGSARR